MSQRGRWHRPTYDSNQPLYSNQYNYELMPQNPQSIAEPMMSQFHASSQPYFYVPFSSYSQNGSLQIQPEFVQNVYSGYPQNELYSMNAYGNQGSVTENGFSQIARYPYQEQNNFCQQTSQQMGVQAQVMPDGGPPINTQSVACNASVEFQHNKKTLSTGNESDASFSLRTVELPVRDNDTYETYCYPESTIDTKVSTLPKDSVSQIVPQTKEPKNKARDDLDQTNQIDKKEFDTTHTKIKHVDNKYKADQKTHQLSDRFNGSKQQQSRNFKSKLRGPKQHDTLVDTYGMRESMKNNQASWNPRTNQKPFVDDEGSQKKFRRDDRTRELQKRHDNTLVETTAYYMAGLKIDHNNDLHADQLTEKARQTAEINYERETAFNYKSKKLNENGRRHNEFYDQQVNHNYNQVNYYGSRNVNRGRHGASRDDYCEWNDKRGGRSTSDEQPTLALYLNSATGSRGKVKNKTKQTENWEGSKSRTSSSEKNSSKNNFAINSANPTEKLATAIPEDEASQRDSLIEQLTKGTYECMVCCDRVCQKHTIWSCHNCYHCFHMGCIQKWAKTSHGTPGWRCPACQLATSRIPSVYLCFCGKMREPDWNRRDTPHSCGEVCGRNRPVDWCTHRCNVLCHPGPCPPCTAYLKRTCPCGAKSQSVRCSQTEPLLCQGRCGKQLNCGIHTCEKMCHTGDCDLCDVMIQQICHCKKEQKEVVCTADTVNVTTFACGSICDKLLGCGNHKCQSKCHLDECEPCTRTLDAITSCPCGKTSLSQLYENVNVAKRRGCSDPVPTCGKKCGRMLQCGTPGNFHHCQASCHDGLCPLCPLETAVRCRCGFMDKMLPCCQLLVKADEVTCEKQCKKMRQCGRHRCGIKCCIDVDHLCSLLCALTLSCGLHKCQEPCHRGNCPRCWQTSFEELSCYCGAEVTFPPVPCGTKPPLCTQPCIRDQQCQHSGFHNCHPEQTCPPCTVLVDKPCFGNHKKMRSTPCYVKALSCGAPCGKALPCGFHVCQKVCHEAPCLPVGTACNQKCKLVKESCGHMCSSICHLPPCPDVPCREKVTITCFCGTLKVTLTCADNDREYRVLATSMLASQMSSGGSVDLSQILTGSARQDKLKRLSCDEECLRLDRNRRLALALQIENPDERDGSTGTSASGFSDFLKDETKKDFVFAKLVHDALTTLVMKAQESKQKSRSHSFAPMNRDKRHFIHDYCEHFGCSSQAYDEEPKKNVVATAVKGICHLPPLSVMAFIQKEQGQKKVPAPVWERKASNVDVSFGMTKLERCNSTEKEVTCDSKPTPIDYFDFEN